MTSFSWLQDALAVAVASGLPVYILNLYALLVLMSIPLARVGDEDVSYFLMGIPVAIGYVLFLQEQIKDIIIDNELVQWVQQTATEASRKGVMMMPFNCPVGDVDLSCLVRFTRLTHSMGSNTSIIASVNTV